MGVWGRRVLQGLRSPALSFCQLHSCHRCCQVLSSLSVHYPIQGARAGSHISTSPSSLTGIWGPVDKLPTSLNLRVVQAPASGEDRHGLKGPWWDVVIRGSQRAISEYAVRCRVSQRSLAVGVWAPRLLWTQPRCSAPLESTSQSSFPQAPWAVGPAEGREQVPHQCSGSPSACRDTAWSSCFSQCCSGDLGPSPLRPSTQHHQAW